MTAFKVLDKAQKFSAMIRVQSIKVLSLTADQVKISPTPNICRKFLIEIAGNRMFAMKLTI